MATPHNHGYKQWPPVFKFEGISERTLEMIKVAFCLLFAAWMTGCLMTIVFSREIATFIVEHQRMERIQ